jgi:uncharacterized heparinase superfamily protein
MLGGPRHVSVARENRADSVVLRAAHDGYADACGIVHERTITLAADGTRLEGEDVFLSADGGEQVRTSRDHYAVRFHLHPSVKATLLTEDHGVVLVAPNNEVWTFNAPEERVGLEDSVYLSGTDGPRRTVQMVIYGHASSVPRVVWSFQQTDPAAAEAVGRRVRGEQPKLTS